MEGLYKANILGRDRDVYFGMPAIEYVFDKIDFAAISKMSSGEFEIKDLKTIAHFVYGGLLGGCERKDEPLDFEFGDIYSEVEKWALDGNLDAVVTVGKAFSESYAVKKLAESLKSKGSKKKQKSTIEG